MSNEADKPSLATAEKESRISITVLYIAVHPHYRNIAGSNTDITDPEYIVGQDNLHQQIERRFLPQSSSEITLISPNMRYDVRRGAPDATDQWKHEQAPVGMHTWETLYKSLSVKAPGELAGNILLIRNLVDIYHPLSIHELEGELARLGFEVTSETQIIIGGEMLQLCVKIALETLLSGLPQVNSIKIDRRAVSEIPNRELGISKNLFDVVVGEEYILVSKKPRI